LGRLRADGVLPPEAMAALTLDRTRQKDHGDFATNIALTLAKAAKLKPRDLAEKIVAALPASPEVTKVEIAGPGFINFFLSPAAYQAVVPEILRAGAKYGRSEMGAGQNIMVEFVSANPNGPLHVGHGRGAAYGDSLARLLKTTGYTVHTEYYINDAGRQMDILAVSVWLRYLELCGETVVFPANGYRGDYVRDIAGTLRAQAGEALRRPAAEVFRDLPLDEVQGSANAAEGGMPGTAEGPGEGGDKEAHIDALIERARALLGEDGYTRVHAAGLDAMLANIREDLREFGVQYDEWFSEKSLMTSGAVEHAMAVLKERGHLYEKEGALWFRSSAFGDEKDRVVVRENGVTTYFASDIAYHLNKIERGFSHCIDIWGADHHGYVPRVRAALTAMGKEADWLTVLLVQFAILFRGGQKVQMSTRSGSFVTLRELRGEVGNDAARFFYVLRKSEQHMDFDLDLAKSQSNDNPVFYIQYAHARICSVFRQLREKGLTYSGDPAVVQLDLLRESHEESLLNRLVRYPEVVEEAARTYEPHQVAYYLRDLATDLHAYYNAHQFLLEEPALREARLTLIDATRQVLGNGLRLLGVSAPESM
jgi:arginyl-tRNA synthetase